jgi:hypothetical protein
VFFWIPALAGMTAFAVINVAVYKLSDYFVKEIGEVLPLSF